MIAYSHRVRYHEADAQGFLFNGRYLEIADVAMTEYFRALGWSYAELVAGGADPSVVNATLTFMAPGRFDDILEIDVACTRIGRSSFTLTMEFLRDRSAIARAELTYVNVDAASARSRELPDAVARALRAGPGDRAGALPASRGQVAGAPGGHGVALAADRRLPALDADLPERRDHVVRGRLGDLDEREAVGDLDRADVLAGQVRLAGDDTDEILRPDSGGTAGPHEQPRGARGARPAAALVGAVVLAPRAAVVRRGQVDLGQLFFVAGRSAGVAWPA